MIDVLLLFGGAVCSIASARWIDAIAQRPNGAGQEDRAILVATLCLMSGVAATLVGFGRVVLGG